MIGRFTLILVVASVGFGSSPLSSLAVAGVAAAAAADTAIVSEWGVKIPLRDGIRLNATVYRPREIKTLLPAIFTLTPYIADTYHARAMYFAKRGYVFATVDTRGRGNSEGEFEPFANEGRDGHDVVEWLAKQPWCNGKVTMWGGSYAGFDQWSTLKEFPPHLATIVPVASAHSAVDFPFFANILYPYEVQWLTYTSGVTPQANLFQDSGYWIQQFRKLYLEHRPFRTLDSLAGNPSASFQKWLEHATPDEYWDTMAPAPEDYRRVNLPILTITGHYDGDQPGALHYYRLHMRHGSPPAKAQHYLILGPWDHAGTRTPTDEVGGLKFGPACLLDMNDLHRQWYDWTLKGGKKPPFLKDRVAYYVAGAEAWKYAKSLDAIAPAPRVYNLSSDGHANGAFRSGSLAREPAAASTPDRWTYDPLDTRPADLEREEIKNFVTDQRYALNLYGNGIVYHTDALAEDTEISGQPRLVLWLSMDVPDTDLQATLYEIRLDGSSVQLTAAQLRARYRESLREARLVTPGAVERYVLDNFTWFSRRVAKGSRLRLVVGCPNSIYTQKNYNSGGVVADESARDARTAHITLHHDPKRPSALEVPVVKP